MAKVKLAAGAEIDLLSSDEHKHQTDRVVQALAELSKNLSTTTHHIEGLITDASGNIGGGVGGPGHVLYRVTTSYAAAIHRYAFNAAGYTPGTPLQTGWLMIVENDPNGLGNLVVPLPGTSNNTVAPVTFTDGRASAYLLRRGSELRVIGGGLPDNLPISIGLQLRLIEGAEDVT